MRYLRKPFDYANAGNYVAPGKPWDGLSRISTPTDNDLSVGATPDVAIAAEKENGRNKIVSDAQYLQAFLALHNWDHVFMPQVGTDAYAAVIGMRRVRAYGTMTEAQRQVVLLGADASDASKLRYCTSNDGNRLQTSPAKFAASGFASASYAAPGAAGEIMVTGVNNTLVAYTSNSGSSWLGTTPFSGPPTMCVAHYSEGLGSYFLINNTASGSGACGRQTTLAAVVAAPTLSNIPITAAAHIVPTKCEMADNGSIVMLACVDDAGAVAVYRSTNGGSTWSLSLTGAGTDCNLVYSDYYGLFFFWDSSGSLRTSSDGAAWTVIRSNLTPANGFLAGRGTLAAVGAALVKSTSTGSSAGIAFSFDMGSTWFYHYIDGGDVGGAFALRSINNRLYAIDSAGLRLYRSGQLGAPNVAEF